MTNIFLIDGTIIRAKEDLSVLDSMVHAAEAYNQSFIRITQTVSIKASDYSTERIEEPAIINLRNITRIS